MHRVRVILLLLFAILHLLPEPTDSQQIFNGFVHLNNDVVKIMVEKFRVSLTDYLSQRIQPELVKNELDKLKYNVETVDGEQLQNSFTAGVQHLLDDKMKVLVELKDKAETAELGHTYEEKPVRDPYFNMRDIRDIYDYNTTVKMVPTFSDSVPVNLTDSFVQVPTNVFAYKSEVLNQVTWGKKLDAQFRKNYDESNNTLLYQYFGDASTGIFRIYPGNVIGVKDDDAKTDLYDCRRRVWYIQAAASAKDIVIVLDVSGSMIGNNIGIAKITIASLIDTLQENDYFNVIMVNTTATYLVPCITYLIQATKQNKEMMKRQVQKLTEASGTIDVDVGMDEAFNILNVAGPSLNRTSAGCNQAIMFITDGIEGEYAGKKSFEKNNKEKRVRVFSYLVGRIKNPDNTALIKMSCQNYGHFYQIETLGNIWDTVLDYLRVMSRPLIPDPYDPDKLPTPALKPVYTPAYLDSAGFGMVMSISMNAFKRKKPVKKTSSTSINNNNNNANLIEYEAFLGVAGTDISLVNLKDKVEFSVTGSFSRGFIINNNGFVLIHPKFRDQSGYLPTPPNVLIDELEHSLVEGDIASLKEQMLSKLEVNTVNGKTETPSQAQQQNVNPFKSEQIKTRSLYDNGRKVYTSETTYWYKVVPGTDLVSAFALSESDSTYLTVDKTTPDFDTYMANGQNALNITIDNFDYEFYNLTKANTSYVTIAPWNYCDIPPVNTKPLGVKNYPTAQELYEFLAKNPDNTVKHCSSKLIERLLVMAGAVDKVTSEIWDNIASDGTDDIKGMFVATSSGFQKYISFHNGTKPTKPYDRDILRTKLFETPKALPDISLFLSTPVLAENAHLSNESIKITAFYPIKEKDQLIAVTGAEVDSAILRKMLMTATVHKLNSLSILKFCESESTGMCTIIDDHGYVVTSNQDTKFTGRFFGEMIGPLVKGLQDLDLMSEVILEDSQAECPELDEPSSANILMTPARLLFGALTAFCKSFYWLVVKIGVILVTLFELTQRTDAQLPQAIFVSCTKTMPFYKFDLSKFTGTDSLHTGKFKCNNCPKNAKSFKVQWINGTNTFALFAETTIVQEGKTVDCGCYNEKVSLRHVRKHANFDWCNPPKQPFRQAPMTCFNDTGRDPLGAKCGSGSISKPSPLILLVTITLSLTLLRLVYS